MTSRVSKASRSTAPDMQDVARLAGVSPQTVSRTLRGYKHVSAAARQKVLAAVNELGYRRNGSASSLASGHTRAIGVVALGEGSFRFEVMRGISAVADAAEYTVNMVTTASSRPADLERAVSRLLDQSVAGIVLALTVSETSDELERLIAEAPTIAVGGERPDWSAAISVDAQAATRNAVRYLLDLGHETVSYITGFGGTALEGAWRDELIQQGRPIPEILEGDWSPESGYELGKQLALDTAVTAVLVAGDDMAFGAMRALADAGVRIPDDMSIMGSADNHFSPWSSPPLSSIEALLDERGARSARYLLHLLDDDDEPFFASPTVPRLVIRASTASPPRATS
jgi:DNA-binding LacI/PurR family transcriptional regulator